MVGDYRYQTGGSLAKEAASYVERAADRQLYRALCSGELCYVFNARQMGKSSLRVRMQHRLQQEGMQCAYLDLTAIGTEAVTIESWYRGIMLDLSYSFGFFKRFNLRQWWADNSDIPPAQQLYLFFKDVLLTQLPKEQLFIFIDELDSALTLPFPIDDFFALIRACYEQRFVDDAFKRLNWSLLGVVSPSELIRDRTRTPFNIGNPIALNGFTLDEAFPLATGLAQSFQNPQTVLSEILKWTGGQPFLTQKLCSLAVYQTNTASSKAGTLSSEGLSKNSSKGSIAEADWVSQLVQQHIIQNWQTQDHPEHLRTIQDRLLRSEQQAGQLLTLYQQLYLQQNVDLEGNRPEPMELFLSGLVKRAGGKLQIANPIYAQIFDCVWVEYQLNNLRPYADAFNQWLASEQQDKSRLLRGQALQDAQVWIQGKSLGQEDYEFVRQSEQLSRQMMEQSMEAERLKETEAKLAEIQKRRVQEQKTVKLQRILLGISGVALLLVSSVSAIAFSQYRAARKEAIKALVNSADARFSSQQNLSALVESMRAYNRLKVLNFRDPDLVHTVELSLRQAVYGAKEHNQLGPHSNWVNGVAISPDGETIATLDRGGLFTLWNADGSLRKRMPDLGTGWQVTFSPNGQLMATSGLTIQIWTGEGTLKGELPTSRNATWGLDFSTDSRWLLSSGFDETVKLWNVEKMELVRTFTPEAGAFWEAKFLPGEQAFLTIGLDHSLQIWSITGELEQTLAGHTSRVHAIAISPDGETIVSAGTDQTLRFWQRNGELIKIQQLPEGSIWELEFSPDGKLLAAARESGEVWLWNQAGKLVDTLGGHDSSVWDIAFSADGQTLATASGDETAKLWTLSGSLMRLHDYPDRVISVATSRQAQVIAAGGDDGTIYLWTLEGEFIRKLTGHKVSVTSLEISPDGQWLISGGDENQFRIWQLATGELLHTVEQETTGLLDTAISPDNTLIAHTSLGKEIRVLTSTGELVSQFGEASFEHESPVFDDKGETLFTVTEQAIWQWSLDGEILNKYSSEGTKKERLIIHQASQTLITGADNGQVEVWTTDGLLKKDFQAHESEIWNLAVHPQKQMLATAGIDGFVKLWDFEGTLLGTLNGHRGGVFDVTFSPDGTKLISGGEDSQIIFWDLSWVIDRDDVYEQGCEWVRDYLTMASGLSERDRRLCE